MIFYVPRWLWTLFGYIGFIFILFFLDKFLSSYLNIQDSKRYEKENPYVFHPKDNEILKENKKKIIISAIFAISIGITLFMFTLIGFYDLIFRGQWININILIAQPIGILTPQPELQIPGSLIHIAADHCLYPGHSLNLSCIFL